MKIVLCGPPCAGKSTVAKLLAKHLSCKHFDTDLLLEDTYEKEFGQRLSCREIFQKKGEHFFRRKEKEIILSLQEETQGVIALGGGIFDVKLGVTIYLKASLQTLWERVCQRKKPPAYIDPVNPRKSFEEHVIMRFDAYAAIADFIIETDAQSPNDVAKLIKESIHDGRK